MSYLLLPKETLHGDVNCMHKIYSFVQKFCFEKKLFSYFVIDIFDKFYIQGSVHRYSILIRSNKMQQMKVYITAKLLYMFRASIDPIIRSTSNCNYGFWYISYCKYKTFLLRVWHLLEAVVTVWCAPEDGVNGCLKHVEQFCSNIYLYFLHLVGSYWYIFDKIMIVKGLKIKK